MTCYSFWFWIIIPMLGFSKSVSNQKHTMYALSYPNVNSCYSTCCPFWVFDFDHTILWRFIHIYSTFILLIILNHANLSFRLWFHDLASLHWTVLIDLIHSSPEHRKLHMFICFKKITNCRSLQMINDELYGITNQWVFSQE